MRKRIGLLAACLATVILLWPVLGFCANDALTVPAGSVLHVRLTTTLTSKTNKTGDRFTGSVSQPITVNGQEVVPAGSTVEGHVAFIKHAGRIKGKAQMRVVVDDILSPEGDVKFPLAAGLEDTHAGPCASTGKDEEGTIEGCGKSKKDAVKGAAIGAAVGAGAGATVGMGHEIDCEYYGNCGGPGMGTDIGYGAGIGAGTVLIYNLLKHEKDIVLVQGTDLTFVVHRTTTGVKNAQPDQASSPKE
jgi:hypothetical protein